MPRYARHISKDTPARATRFEALFCRMLRLPMPIFARYAAVPDGAFYFIQLCADAARSMRACVCARYATRPRRARISAQHDAPLR